MSKFDISVRPGFTLPDCSSGIADWQFETDTQGWTLDPTNCGGWNVTTGATVSWNLGNQALWLQAPLDGANDCISIAISPPINALILKNHTLIPEVNPVGTDEQLIKIEGFFTGLGCVTLVSQTFLDNFSYEFSVSLTPYKGKILEYINVSTRTFSGIEKVDMRLWRLRIDCGAGP